MPEPGCITNEPMVSIIRTGEGGEGQTEEEEEGTLEILRMPIESASRPIVGFGVLNDNLIKCLISFVEVHEQILSNRYKGIHGYITQSTIMMQMELCDQCV
jgi:hypothetical protein